MAQIAKFMICREEKMGHLNLTIRGIKNLINEGYSGSVVCTPIGLM